MTGLATIMAMGRSTVGGGASSLLTGLQVYYALSDLTDASGGGLTLTNNNTVTFGTGKVNNAATFVSASSQRLSRATSAAFVVGTGDFAIAFWFKTTTTTSFQALACYGIAGAGNDYGAYIKDDGAGYGIKCFIEDSIGGGGTSDANAALNDGNWHLCIANYNRASNVVVTVDNSTYATKTISTAGSMTSNANGFALGAQPSASNFLDGSIDEFGLWNRVLTGGELTTLWNSGAGTTYPF